MITPAYGSPSPKGNYIVDSLRWYVFFKALKALDVKAWANGPGLGRYVIRSAESAAYVCSRAPDSCRARFAQRWSHCALSALQLPLLRPPARWAGLLHLAPSAQHANSLIR